MEPKAGPILVKLMVEDYLSSIKTSVLFYFFSFFLFFFPHCGFSGKKRKEKKLGIKNGMVAQNMDGMSMGASTPFFETALQECKKN